MGESVDFLAYLEEKLELPEVDLREYSPLVLAYIGDDIFDLVIRTMLSVSITARCRSCTKRQVCW